MSDVHRFDYTGGFCAQARHILSGQYAALIEKSVKAEKASVQQEEQPVQGENQQA